MGTQHEPVFGKIPTRATHWSAKRLTPEGPRRLQWAAPGADAEGREWPLAELSSATLRERWGDGEFEVLWVGYARDGKRSALGHSPAVTIPPQRVIEVAPVAAPATAPTPMLSGLTDFFQLHSIITAQANAQADRDRQFLLAVTQTQKNDGPDPTIVNALAGIGRVLEQTNEAMATMAARIAELEAGGADDDEEANAKPFVTKANAPMSEQAKAALGNLLAEHGGSLIENIPAIVELLKSKANGASTAAAAKPAPAAAAAASA